MAQQPYPGNGPEDTSSVPDVGVSYDASGLATEAGPISDMPMPSGGHPATYSGITAGSYNASEDN